MTQFLRPISDITISNWTPLTSSDCFAMLDDASTGATADSDYVTCSLSSNVHLLEMAITTAADPLSEGTQVIQIRARANVTTSVTKPMTAAIHNASTQLFEFLSTAAITAGSFNDYSFTLTTDNIASLTGNYDNLRVRLSCVGSTVNESINVSLFVWEMPDAAPPLVTLTVDGATHAQTADGVVLEQHNILLVADAAQAQAVDNVVLLQHNILEVQNAAQAQSADNVIVTYNAPGIEPVTLIVANALQAQTVDNVALIQHSALVVADASQSQTVDNVDLVQHNILAADNSAHAQTVENVTLAQHNTLAVDNSAHAQTAGNVVVVYNAPAGEPTLAVDNAAQAQAAENVDVVQHNTLDILGATDEMSSEGVTITYHPPGSSEAIPVSHGSVFTPRSRDLVDRRAESMAYWRQKEDEEILLLFMAIEATR